MFPWLLYLLEQLPTKSDYTELQNGTRAYQVPNKVDFYKGFNHALLDSLTDSKFNQRLKFCCVDKSFQHGKRLSFLSRETFNQKTAWLPHYTPMPFETGYWSLLSVQPHHAYPHIEIERDRERICTASSLQPSISLQFVQ